MFFATSVQFHNGSDNDDDTKLAFYKHKYYVTLSTTGTVLHQVTRGIKDSINALAKAEIGNRKLKKGKMNLNDKLNCAVLFTHTKWDCNEKMKWKQVFGN